MKKELQLKKLTLGVLFFSILFGLQLASCKKSSDLPAIEIPGKGNFELEADGVKIKGDENGGSAYSQTDELTQEPSLEVHLAGTDVQIDIRIEKPQAGATYDLATAQNVFVSVGKGNEFFDSAITPAGSIKLTTLTEKGVKGTFSANLSNAANRSQKMNVRNGSFAVNF